MVVQELPEHLPEAKDFDYRKLSQALAEIHLESVISVRGLVALRDPSTARPV